MQDDLSLNVVVAVGCVCGFIVLLLVIILVMLCYHRHRAIKKCENIKNRSNLSSLSSSRLPTESSQPKQKNGKDPSVNLNRPEVANNHVIVFKTHASGRSPVHFNSSSAPTDERGSHLAEDGSVQTAAVDNEKNSHYEMENVWKSNVPEKSSGPAPVTSDVNQNQQDRNADKRSLGGDTLGLRSKKIIHEVIV